MILDDIVITFTLPVYWFLSVKNYGKRVGEALELLRDALQDTQCRKLSFLFGENKQLEEARACIFLMKDCSLTGLANVVAWPSRRAPPFNSSEDSAPEHLVELEIQRQHMNVNNPNLPREIQNFCLYKEEMQRGRNHLPLPRLPEPLLPPLPPLLLTPPHLLQVSPFVSSSHLPLCIQPDLGL